jgi:hypothetical protein
VAAISSSTSAKTSRPAGYLSHNATTVELYLQESLTFRSLTSEAAVALAPQGKQGRLFPAR